MSDLRRKSHDGTLPPARGQLIDECLRESKDDVEGLRGLRQAAGKAQADVAAALHIKQPSVSKIEKQTDMYLSTLRSYVQAIGGDLELLVTLPSRAAIRLLNLGDNGLRPKTTKRPRASNRAKGAGASRRVTDAS